MTVPVPTSATDYLANERTFLAWVRTGITVIALGFVVARFNLLIRELSGSGSALESPYASTLGILLVLTGAALVLLAQGRYIHVRASLERGEYKASDGLMWVVTGAMVAVGVALAVYLAATA